MGCFRPLGSGKEDARYPLHRGTFGAPKSPPGTSTTVNEYT